MFESLFFLGAAVLFVGFIGYTVMSKKGRGRLLGGQIVESISPSVRKKRGSVTTTVQIHRIQLKGDNRPNHIAVEICSRALLGFTIAPITLTESETKQLIMDLQTALPSPTEIGD